MAAKEGVVVDSAADSAESAVAAVAADTAVESEVSAAAAASTAARAIVARAVEALEAVDSAAEDCYNTAKVVEVWGAMDSAEAAVVAGVEVGTCSSAGMVPAAESAVVD